MRAAAQLIRRKGVAGTGMREIVAEADAPRGSLQHYFPAGKEELVGEALAWMGGVAARRVRRHVARLESGPPSRLLSAIVEDWCRDLTTEQFAVGCPLVAAAADVSATSDGLREVICQAFASWQEPLGVGLAALGVDPARAEPLAVVVISCLEGAIILARVQRDLAPLEALNAELGPILDAAVTR
ncbi:MAG: helix-turn-helix transcriptional regulator [Acidimicrobiales bacterium]|nr:helix-turn-helix transcriptional regulator [Acidimicrobiales bacterium]